MQPELLREALEDIDAYLEEMPAKTDDWSIGYKAITPFVKSLRLLREQFSALESENERLKETALTQRQAEHILRIRQARVHWFQPTCLCDECTDTYGVLCRIAAYSGRATE